MKILKCIYRLWKQLWCKHDWRRKGDKTINQWFYFEEFRCPKCKKIIQRTSL